jgi:hypothetical protein
MIENHKCNGVGMRVYVAYKSRERCDEFPRGILMSTVYDEKQGRNQKNLLRVAEK